MCWFCKTRPAVGMKQHNLSQSEVLQTGDPFRRTTRTTTRRVEIPVCNPCDTEWAEASAKRVTRNVVYGAAFTVTPVLVGIWIGIWAGSEWAGVVAGLLTFVGMLALLITGVVLRQRSHPSSMRVYDTAENWPVIADLILHGWSLHAEQR
jgi:hypothetical protein